MSRKKKDPSENAAKEPRRDDQLWKELLSRFFVPMLHSLLPDLARDLDEKRDVAFLVVEAKPQGFRFDISERHGICGL